MKQTLQFSFLLLLVQLSVATPSHSQDTSTPTHLLRIYWDDDYLNFYGKGTDRGYTDGLRLEYMYAKRNPPSFPVDKILPEAGDSSINLYSWGLTQLMFTPTNISNAGFQPNDYPWSGALFATHTLYSYNERKKMDIQTELVLGVMGPWALAGELQTAVHHMIHYIKPMGWNNQYRNSLLLNVNLTEEKQVLKYGDFLEVIAGAHVYAGTMINELAVYPLIRIGKMTSYFNGFISQYSRSKKQKVQFYITIKPELEWVLSNSLLEGGFLPTRKQTASPKGTEPQPVYHTLNHAVPSFAYGPTLSLGHFSISATQTTAGAWMKGLYGNNYGNLSLYFSW